MTQRSHFSRETFARRFPQLILGRSGLPKKRSDMQMLLASVVFSFEFEQVYSEREVNDLIRGWVSRFGHDLPVDHVTLRRYLVDEGVLDRDGSGSRYQLSNESPFFSYDRSIRDLDLEDLIAQALEARAARKRSHTPDRGPA